MRSARWPLVVAVVAAVVTAALLGAALVQSESDRARGLLVLAIVALLTLVAAGGVWAFALRRDSADPFTERAETASKLSHEIKNPLMAIKGLASTGSRMFEQLEDGERKEFFALIDDEAGRLSRVVEQAANALKVDAESLIYDFRDEDLGAMVEQVAWGTPHGYHPMSVETDAAITLLADRKHLSEAIGNLIDNAAKFSPPDAPIEVTVRHGEDGTAVIEIADRGPGIPSERVLEVFERFGSWRPAGYEETPGAGLGLFLARAHALAHGGRVYVADRDDGGTILRVTLPTQG